MFAQLILFKKFKTVTYYTVKCDDRKLSAAEDFFTRMNEVAGLNEQLERLVWWMMSVGNSYSGIEKNMLRFEDRCFALPSYELRTENGKTIELRLYCYWVNENILILFNGDKKTKPKALDCQNVRKHFMQAQTWTNQIIRAGLEYTENEIANTEEILIKC
ncbi:MAG: hypothetical protein IAF38_06210 [Bacteroidia bacterium]|nr:hypothetical protein [Bacteroidia bacterium]